MKASMEWEEKWNKEEIIDSQMEEEATIQTVNSKKNLEKWVKQEDEETVNVSEKPAAGSLANIIDM